MSKPTIAFDIDDVLAANAEGFTEFSNNRWGTHLKPDDYTEHWSEMWGIDHTETVKRRNLILSEKLFTSYRFFNEAKAVLNKLSQSYKLVVVSSRSNEIHKETLEWLNSEFKAIFSEIHFAQIWDDPNLHVLKKLKMTKTDVCQQIGADYLVDDQPKHCIAAAKAGITAVLFGEYGWNRNVKLIKNLIRALNWEEVQKYFDEQAR